jgi:hypothetical protein
MNITLAIPTPTGLTVNTLAAMGKAIDRCDGIVALVSADDAKFAVGRDGGLPSGYLRTLCQESRRNPMLDAALAWLTAHQEAATNFAEWGAINAPGTFGDWFFFPAAAVDHAIAATRATGAARRWTCEGPKGLIVAYTGSAFLLHQGRSPIAPDRWVDVESYGSPVQYPGSRRPDSREQWAMTVMPAQPVVFRDPSGQHHCADPTFYRADNIPA